MNSDIAGGPKLSFARFWLLPGLVYLAGWAILTWPAALSFTTHFFCDAGDGLQNVWNIWWIHEAIVVKHVSPYFTDMLYHPVGASLIAQTLNPHNGLLAIGVGTVLDQHASHNALVVFAFVAGGMTSFALAWHVSRSWAGSLLAGAVFTFSHYHFAHALGHMQLVSLQWIPLFVLQFLRMLETPSARRGLAAGASLLLVALCDWYYVFFCVIAGAVLYGWQSARQRAPLLVGRKGYRGAFATFLAIVVPPLFAFAKALLDLNRRDPLVGSHPPEENSADLLACFIPGGSWRFAEWTQAYWEHVGGVVEASIYVGFTVLGLALWSRARLWLGLAVLFWLMSLGPVLHVVGAPVPWLPMPYRLLEVLVPPLSLSGCPVRMNVMVTLFLGVACAIGFAPFLRLLRYRALHAAFLALLVFEYLPWQQQTTRIEHPDYLAALRALPEGAVHIADVEHATELYYQTVHERPILLGYLSRWPESLWHRRDKVKDLLEAGQYAELLRTFQGRYLVIPNENTRPEQQCAPVFFGTTATIWVANDDELARTRSTWRVQPRDDKSLELHLCSPQHANRRFVCVFSRQRTEPSAAGGLPIAIDDVAEISIDPNNKTFPGSVGVLDAEGRAIVGVDKELVRQRGLGEVWFTWYVLDAWEPRYDRVGPLVSLRID